MSDLAASHRGEPGNPYVLAVNQGSDLQELGGAEGILNP